MKKNTTTYAVRTNNLLRLNCATMTAYKGNKHVTIKIDGKNLILTSEGYDATLCHDSGNGAHFSVTKLGRRVFIPTGKRFVTDVEPEKIVIHLDKEVIDDRYYF